MIGPATDINDIQCQGCTVPDNISLDATYTCSGDGEGLTIVPNTDGTNTYCADGYYYTAGTGNNNDSCSIHTTTCPSGQYISAEGTDTSDIQCTNCTRPDYTAADASLTCSSTDGIENTIRIIPNMDVGGSQRYCQDGYYYRIDPVTNNGECTEQLQDCPPGQYISSPATDTSDTICSNCTPILNAASGYTYICTTDSDSRISACTDGFYIDGSGPSDQCTLCETIPNISLDASYTCTGYNQGTRIIPDTGGTNTYCLSGYFHRPGINTDDNDNCQQHQSECPEGQYILEGNDISDSSCTIRSCTSNSDSNHDYICPSGYNINPGSDNIYRNSPQTDLETCCYIDNTQTCSQWGIHVGYGPIHGESCSISENTYGTCGLIIYMNV